MSLYKILKNRTRRSIVKAGLVSLLMFGGKELYAKDIHIPRDYPTIQTAIDDPVVVNGDKVIVAPGIYKEHINFRGKNITLRSERGPEETIIKGGYLTFNSGETNEALVQGFMIIQSHNPMYGAIRCERSSPTIRNNIITENMCGIACLRADPLIISNIISKNSVGESGGGIYCDDNSRAMILENIIRDNYADTRGGGIYCGGGSSVIIRGNYIVDNFGYEDGGGIYVTFSNTKIEQNIIVGNRAKFGAGGIQSRYSHVYIIGNTVVNNLNNGVWSIKDNEIALLNNIVYTNMPNNLSGVQLSQVYYSDIGDEEFCGINHNICLDPLFVDPENDDYRLRPDSPCIDAGTDQPIPLGYGEMLLIGPDLDGTQRDMGALFYDRRIPFRRGDVNRDGKVDISDAVAGLYHVFKGRELECKDAADVNDDGKIDVADPIHLLDYLFRDGPLPSEPFSEPGLDQTRDWLTCEEYDIR